MRKEIVFLFRIIKILLFYVMLLWLGSMLLFGNIMVSLLILTPKTFREPLVQKLISHVFRLFLWGAVTCKLMQIDLNALDVLNYHNKMLLVANHPSMIDVFLIISRLHNVICLMKSSISNNIFLGIGAYLAGYISNRQIDIMIRSAINSVNQGSLLLIFPEATRTTRQPINQIKSSAILIAKYSKVVLQTVLITTNSPYLSKGWKIWRPPEFPLIYRVTLGHQFWVNDQFFTNNHLQDYFESALIQSIDSKLKI